MPGWILKKTTHISELMGCSMASIHYCAFAACCGGGTQKIDSTAPCAHALSQIEIASVPEGHFLSCTHEGAAFDSTLHLIIGRGPRRPALSFRAGADASHGTHAPCTHALSHLMIACMPEGHFVLHKGKKGVFALHLTAGRSSQPIALCGLSGAGNS